MNNKTQTFTLNNQENFTIKMLNWAYQFNIFCFLDNHEYTHTQPSFNCMLAVASSSFITEEPRVFHSIRKRFPQNEWLFGHINYPSKKKDDVGFPSASFFTPEILLQINGNTVSILSEAEDPQSVFHAIENSSDKIDESRYDVLIQHRITEAEYLNSIKNILYHIQRGDCYEINFCQEFFAEKACIDPLSLFYLLNNASPVPFAAFYKLHDKFCIGASPERFIRKLSDRVISQPIKGTTSRMLDDVNADIAALNSLKNSEKERAENVMIVDLVRNDLSRFCQRGTVKVTELFGVYSFPQVHQMISTIEGRVAADLHWTDILDHCYPMGSMTGAPKKRVMELIEQYEATPRGLFSGTIGYVTPEGNFDFNVVIRSVFYNQTTQSLLFKSGGGITSNSNPQMEYEESLIKAAAIKKILQSESD